MCYNKHIKQKRKERKQNNPEQRSRIRRRFQSKLNGIPHNITERKVRTTGIIRFSKN